jgi:hypothetical protein
VEKEELEKKIHEISSEAASWQNKYDISVTVEEEQKQLIQVLRDQILNSQASAESMLKVRPSDQTNLPCVTNPGAAMNCTIFLAEDGAA